MVAMPSLNMQGFQLANQGIQALGQGLTQSYNQQQDITLANALATGAGDYAGAMQAAARSGNMDLVLKLQEMRQTADLQASNAADQSKLFNLLGGGGGPAPATTSTTAPTTGTSAVGATNAPGSAPTADLQPHVDATTAKYNLDPSYVPTTLAMESAGGRNLGSRGNPGQFDQATANRVGIPDAVNNPYSSVLATGALADSNAQILQARLGRPITPGEAYLAHQQGPEAAYQMLANPDMRAADAAGSVKAISGNLPKGTGDPASISGGDFANYWVSRYNATAGNLGYRPGSSLYASRPAGGQVSPTQPGPTQPGFGLGGFNVGGQQPTTVASAQPQPVANANQANRATQAAPSAPTRPTQQGPTPVVPPTPSGSPSDISDVTKLDGFTSIRNRSDLMSFMSAHGITIDPTNLNWCAALVQAHLANVGIQGPQTSTIPGEGGVGTRPAPASYGGYDLRASSFQNWGQPIAPSGVQSGDVLVANRSRPGVGAADPSGHVGLATGNTRMQNGQLQYEMESGNVGGAVARQWVNASDYSARRGAPGSLGSAQQPGQQAAQPTPAAARLASFPRVAPPQPGTTLQAALQGGQAIPGLMPAQGGFGDQPPGGQGWSPVPPQPAAQPTQAGTPPVAADYGSAGFGGSQAPPAPTPPVVSPTGVPQDYTDESRRGFGSAGPSQDYTDEARRGFGSAGPAPPMDEQPVESKPSPKSDQPAPGARPAARQPAGQGPYGPPTGRGGAAWARDFGPGAGQMWGPGGSIVPGAGNNWQTVYTPTPTPGLPGTGQIGMTLPYERTAAGQVALAQGAGQGIMPVVSAANASPTSLGAQPTQTAPTAPAASSAAIAAAAANKLDPDAFQTDNPAEIENESEDPKTHAFDLSDDPEAQAWARKNGARYGYVEDPTNPGHFIDAKTVGAAPSTTAAPTAPAATTTTADKLQTAAASGAPDPSISTPETARSAAAPIVNNGGLSNMQKGAIFMGLATKYASLPGVGSMYGQLAQHFLTQDDVPASAKEWLFARQNGYTGGYEDWVSKGQTDSLTQGKQRIAYAQAHWQDLDLPDPKSTAPEDKAKWEAYNTKALGMGGGQVINVGAQTAEKESTKLGLQQVSKGYENATAAITLMHNINDLQGQLDSGKVVAGWGDAQHNAQQLQKIFSQLGFGDPAVAANTDSFNALAARDYVQAAQAAFKGGRITNADLLAAQKSQGLDLAQNPESVRLMLRIQRAYQEMRVEEQNRQVDALEKYDPNVGTYPEIWRVSTDRIPADATLPRVNSDADLAKIPPGRQYLAPDGYTYTKPAQPAQ